MYFIVYDKDCQSAALLFLCQHLFPLYDCSTGTIYTASKEYCATIRTEICAKQWNTAIKFGYGDRLPNYDGLPSNDIIGSIVLYKTLALDYCVEINDTSFNDSVIDTSSNITCKEDFIKINSTCIPHCDKFGEFTHFETNVVISIEVIGSVIASIVSILIIVLSIKDYKRM